MGKHDKFRDDDGDVDRELSWNNEQNMYNKVSGFFLNTSPKIVK